MIYLVGGAPKCGKTTLAKYLSKTAGIPWVSTDSLQNTIKPYVPEQDFAMKFPSSAMQYETNDEKYAEHTFVEIIAAYRQQAKTVFLAIDAFVTSEITDGNDYVIESFHIEPDLIHKLTLEFPGKVRGLLMFQNDVATIKDNILKSTTPNDWILAKTKDEATFLKIAKMIVEYSSQLEAEAKQQDIKTFIVDQNFEAQLQEAAIYLLP